MKILDQNLNKEWYEEYAEGSLIFVCLPAHAIGDGIVPTKNQYKGVATFYFDNKINWFTLVNDQDAITDEIIKRYSENKSYWQMWFLKWKSLDKKFDKLFQQIRKINLSSLTKERLFNLHRKFWNCAINSRRISMITEPFTHGSERLLTKELLNYCNKNKIENFFEIYTTLALPEKSSFLNTFDLEIIKIAQKIKESKRLDRLLKKPAKFVKLSFVKKHLEKYCWIRANWGEAYHYTVEMLVEEIKGLLSLDLEKLKKEKLELNLTNREKKRSIIKKYNFPVFIKNLTILSGFFVSWHDMRKENALKFIYGESLFLKEFSRRFKINYQDLKLFDVTEIREVLENKQSLQHEISKRKKKFLAVHRKGKVYFIFGKKMQQYHEKFLRHSSNKGVKEIIGMAACVGKATGRVKIIHEKKEFDKFKNGEILVTGMTRPEFVPLMRKAAGIITNEGGIACHAAIISRELHKPCVIGTRVATKVLKDGDIVEVNANKGIIRKL